MTDATREALKPCPFCGSRMVAQGATGKQTISVWCMECGTRGPDAPFPDFCDPVEQIEQCHKKWNTRDALQQPEAGGPVAIERYAVADQIIGQIEERFPNWRSFRDLIDCIDVTLHNSFPVSAPPASADMREALEEKLRELDAAWQIHGGPFDSEWVEEVLESLANAQGMKSEGGVEGHADNGLVSSESSTVEAGIKPGPSDSTPPDREAIARALENAAIFLEIGAKHAPDDCIDENIKSTGERLATRGLATVMRETAKSCRGILSLTSGGR